MRTVTSTLTLITSVRHNPHSRTNVAVQDVKPLHRIRLCRIVALTPINIHQVINDNQLRVLVVKLHIRIHVSVDPRKGNLPEHQRNIGG